MSKAVKLKSSFRDPSGSLFLKKNVLYRAVNEIYKNDYDYLISSGLYKKLTKENLLIPHEEVKINIKKRGIYKVLKPKNIPFISYPFEWCFSQLKDAALTTLKIQKLSLAHGMILKDASAYNLCFYKGKPIFIDTLSFERYKEGSAWVAYRQFCQHFFAPLALMEQNDVRLNQLTKIYLDGIPLDLASSLLPKKTYLNFSILSHIHLHAKSQKYFKGRKVKIDERKVGKESLLGLIENLEKSTRRLKWEPEKTQWSSYYGMTNYSKSAFENKRKIVAEFLNKTKIKGSVWDIGSNTGLFSRIASEKGIDTISFDSDEGAVEKNYLKIKRNGEENLLAAVADFTNPSPGIGWENAERTSLIERGPADCVFALALIHHLAISNNLPFTKISEFFSKIGKWLIIEFVEKRDSQVKRLLASRKDIFAKYKKDEFEKAFERHYRIEKVKKIKGTKRTLYLMKRK